MNEATPSLSSEFAALMQSGGGKTFRAARAGGERDEPLRLPDRSSTALLERQEVRTKPPPLYQVLLLNDDFTPMEFVVVVLQKFFMMDLEKATQVMLRVHREGRGVCGVYTRDIAATKVELVSSFARMHQHPLQCVMEEA
jgi:ATP-dependent Clp protease adaptor protein ClpS